MVRIAFRVVASIIAAGVVVASGASMARGATVTFSSRHYEVTASVARPLADELAAHMDTVADEYERRFARFEDRPAARPGLYLFDTEAEYLDFLRRQGVDARHTAGVFFDTAERTGLATYVRGQSRMDVLRTLQHEGFHQFARRRIARDLPTWVDEGIAEWFGEGIVIGTRMVMGQSDGARIGDLRAALADGRFMPLKELLAMDSPTWNARVTSGDARAGLMYLQAWSVVQFLVDADGGRRATALESYLGAFADGAAPDEAFRRAFGRETVPDLERAWHRYVERLEPTALGAAIARVEFLGQGLLLLHAQKIWPGSVEELERLLRQHRFRVTRDVHGQARTIAAQDEGVLAPLKRERGATGVTIELTAPRAREPSGLRVSGLRYEVRLTWERGPDESWVPVVRVG